MTATTITTGRSCIATVSMDLASWVMGATVGSLQCWKASAVRGLFVLARASAAACTGVTGGSARSQAVIMALNRSYWNNVLVAFT